jgi:hypothetical protein
MRLGTRFLIETVQTNGSNTKLPVAQQGHTPKEVHFMWPIFKEQTLQIVSVYYSTATYSNYQENNKIIFRA